MLLVVLFILTCLTIGCFSFVLLLGAPYVPTLKPQVEIALDLLDLKRGATMLELGCGDGRLLIAAAHRGISSIGYELNPILAAIAWFRTRRFGGLVRIVCGDYWRAKWPRAEGVFAFILPRYMGKLHKKVMQYPYRPTKVVSFAFAIPKEKASAERQGVYLYEYK